MIVGITGLPGNGKTLYALAFVKAWSEREGRPVFYHGIKDLKLPWTRLETRDEKAATSGVVPVWWDAPAGSIVVIDEAQMVGFGVRGRGQVPEWAQKLEVHRHLGIDLVLITQDLGNIDGHDRRLIERHFHVVRKWGMQRATVHEFTGGARENAGKSRKGSVRHEWKYPKEAFEWYTSAEQHTHRRHIPLRVWLFLGIPFFIIAMGALAWFKYLDPSLKAKAVAAAASAASAPMAFIRSDGAGKLTADEYLRAYQPRVAGLAFTAPVYDDVTKPVEAPYPAACVRSESKGCRCFSQQGTRLEVAADLCRGIVEGGFFVSWQQKLAPAVPLAQASQDAQRPLEAPSAGSSMIPHTKPVALPAESVLDRDPNQPGGRGRNLPPITQDSQQGPKP